MTQRSYAAFNAGDLNAIAALYEPDCAWHTGAFAMAAGTEAFEGHEGLGDWLRELTDTTSSYCLSIVEARSDGDALLVEGRIDAKAAINELELAMTFWQRLEFRGERILRVFQDAEPPEGWTTAKPVGATPDA